MSIFTAMVNSVTGMRAQSFALENISDNIANSGTTGFKRVDTAFLDMVTDAPLNQQTGGSVLGYSRASNTIAGAVTTSGISTNFAINGQGFVAVRDRLENVGSVPRFSATNGYTRRGDFTLDKDGYMVNGAGQYLVGFPIDQQTRASTGGTPDVVRVQAGYLPAKTTTSVTYTANLPATPHTSNWSASTSGSEIWAVQNGNPPQVVNAGSTPNASSFAANSIPGQTANLFDAKGAPVDLPIRWAKIGNDSSTNTWAMYVNTVPGDTVATSQWTRVSTVTFDSAGRMTSPATPPVVDLSSRGLGSVTFDITGGKLTQLDDASGTASVRPITQDGHAAGVFQGVSINDDGRVVVNYSGGLTTPIAQIALAQFNSPDMLKRDKGSAFSETIESGTPNFGSSDASLIPGSLEGSNTDIAEEFSRMIVTQQAYSANTKVITTAQQLLQDTINIIR